MRFLNAADGICDFMIYSSGILVFILVKRICRIRCTALEIEAELREQLVRLRSIPISGLAIRELWVYTKRSAWRYFRDCGTGLTEINREGYPIKLPEMELHVPEVVIAEKGKGLPRHKGDISGEIPTTLF